MYTTTKRNCIILTVLITIMISLVACQPTPENPIIAGESSDVSHNENIHMQGENLSENDNVHDTTNSSAQRYNNSFSFPEASLTINYDADIKNTHHKNGTYISKVAKRCFSDSTYDVLINIFSNGAPLYECTEKTKAFWQSLLIETQRKNALGDYGPNSNIDEITTELEELAASAVESVTPIPFKWENHGNNEYCGIQFSGKDGTEQIEVERNGNKFCYSKYIDCVLQPEDMVRSGMAITGEPAGTLIETDLSKEEALLKAESITSKLFNDLFLCNSTKARMVRVYSGKIISTGWLLTYTKQIDGLISYDIGRDFVITTKYPPTLVAPWEIELASIFVDESGVAYVNWQGASEEIEDNKAPVEFTEFDNIIEKITSQMKYSFATMGRPDFPCIITINKIYLGTSLLALPNAGQEYGQYVPSWYVYFTFEIFGAPEFTYSDCMVFTATDGRYVEPRMTIVQLMEMQ